MLVSDGARASDGTWSALPGWDALLLLSLNTPKADRPIREIVRVAEHGEGWGVPAEWE